MPIDSDDWHAHRLLIMDKLNSVHEDLSALRDELVVMRRDVGRLHAEVSGLRVRVTLMSAGVATAGTLLVNFLFNKAAHG